MTAPRPTPAETSAALAQHGGELLEVETERLYVLARRPTRDEFALCFDGASVPEQVGASSNNLLVGCIVWPTPAAWQAAVEELPGLLGKLASEVTEDAYPDEVLHLLAGSAVPPEHEETVAKLRARGAALVTICDGKIYGFRKPSRFEREAATAAMQARKGFEAYEALALRCAIDPPLAGMRDAIGAMPGLAVVVGPQLYLLGEYRGAVRSGKLRASSPSS